MIQPERPDHTIQVCYREHERQDERVNTSTGDLGRVWWTASGEHS